MSVDRSVGSEDSDGEVTFATLLELSRKPNYKLDNRIYKKTLTSGLILTLILPYLVQTSQRTKPLIMRVFSSNLSIRYGRVLSSNELFSANCSDFIINLFCLSWSVMMNGRALDWAKGNDLYRCEQFNFTVSWPTGLWKKTGLIASVSSPLKINRLSSLLIPQD